MASNVEREESNETQPAISDQQDEFTEVRRKRKASALDSMDQDESATCEAKRPNFPPLTGQALLSVSI